MLFEIFFSTILSRPQTFAMRGSIAYVAVTQNTAIGNLLVYLKS